MDTWNGKNFHVKKGFSHLLQWCTVWKLHTFSITQIFREIKFRESRFPKYAIFCNFRDSASLFLWIFALFETKIYRINKLQSSKCVEMAIFGRLKSLLLISRKNWVTEKSWKFHTVWCNKWFFTLITFWKKRKYLYALQIERLAPFFEQNHFLTTSKNRRKTRFGTFTNLLKMKSVNQDPEHKWFLFKHTYLLQFRSLGTFHWNSY